MPNYKFPFLVIFSKTRTFGQYSICAGKVVTIAGGCADGSGLRATFNFPWHVEVDSNNHCLYVSDSDNHKICKLTFKGIV